MLEARVGMSPKNISNSEGHGLKPIERSSAEVFYEVSECSLLRPQVCDSLLPPHGGMANAGGRNERQYIQQAVSPT